MAADCQIVLIGRHRSGGPVYSLRLTTCWTFLSGTETKNRRSNNVRRMAVMTPLVTNAAPRTNVGICDQE